MRWSNNNRMSLQITTPWCATVFAFRSACTASNVSREHCRPDGLGRPSRRQNKYAQRQRGFADEHFAGGLQPLLYRRQFASTGHFASANDTCELAAAELERTIDGKSKQCRQQLSSVAWL